MVTNNKKVLLKVIPGKTYWAGVPLQRNCVDALGIGGYPGSYKTGITPEEQKWLEKQMNKKDGEFGTASSFWQDYVFKIKESDLSADGGVEFDLTNPMDFINYKICIQSPKVRNKPDEISQWPQAKYVLVDTDVEIDEAVKVIDLKREAYKLFDSISSIKRRDAVKLLTGKKVTGFSEGNITKLLDEIIVRNPKEFIDLVNSDTFPYLVLVRNLLDYNILRNEKGFIMYGETKLGNTVEDAAYFLSNPDHDELLRILKQKEASQVKI